MKKGWYVTGSLLLALCMSTTTSASISSYLTQSEYSDILWDNYSEDRGIVTQNYPELGYLTYKNSSGQLITCNYYAEEVVVEKQPYYEMEDKIGYLDELFPNFTYDSRDAQITSIQAGDCIYIRTNSERYITYLSAYNDYSMRYGKVVSFNYNTGEVANLQLEDEKGNLYTYDISQVTPVTKGGKMYALSTIKAGDWAKVLISQKILGEGIIEEEVLEIVLDNDTRVISNIYRGQLTSFDTYKKLLNIKNAQALGKSAWGTYNSLMSLAIDTKTAAAYRMGNRISFDYIKRYLMNTDGYVYIAAENYKGKENAVKLNFQSKLQTTLEPSPVIAASMSSIQLLSGETIYVDEDAIIVRDQRLVSANNIMVGDYLQAVVTGENKLAVARIVNNQTTGSLQIYRGRIKKITDRESFEVQTFSLLEDHTWYYHPTPQTFAIDMDTKFYNESGLVPSGIESFLAYGEETSVGDVYTIIAIGEKAYAIIDMPYVKDSVKGEIYAIEDGSIKIKDAYYYDTARKRWMEYSKKNSGGTITLNANSVVIKDGKVVPVRQLEVGDTISAMIETNFKEANGTVNGYIVVVEN
ncbi:MAG: hypothetical protein H9872_06030 [Candidatus Cellulosilyticum pullistercoris]|uniref:S1 motif domain-containing protein n=1 Tax=Candidatus Cellulosilyticum pullistercoris TaxID=2838521 RepID=A0A9E2KB61_9FIRM|nr:hypothetical protein [Candidatus Cellulosilyticum pullistercoris]